MRTAVEYMEVNWNLYCFVQSAYINNQCVLNGSQQIYYIQSMIKNLASQVGQSYQFICPLCLQDYNNTDRFPIEVCLHHHSCCFHCLDQDLFKNIQPNHSVACRQCHSLIKKADSKRFQLFQDVKKAAAELKSVSGKEHPTQEQDTIEQLKQKLQKQRLKSEWILQQYFTIKKLYRTDSQQHQRRIHKYNKNVEKFSRIAWQSQGYQLYLDGKYKEAIELSQDIIKAVPGIDYAISGVGNIEDRAGVSEAFITGWCQQNHKDYSNPYDILCLSFSQLKNYGEAESWYGYRLGKDKNNYRIIVGLANILYNQGKYQKAEQLYLQATQLKPDFEKSYRMLAFIKTVKQNNKQQGKKWATEAKAKNHQSFYADYLLAISEQTADLQIEQLNQISQSTHKNYPRIYNALGSAHKQKKQYDEAVRLFKKCMQMSPSYQVPYYNLGLISQQRGDADEAAQYYEESIKINQNYTNPYLGLANIYTLKKGQQEKAIHWLQKCIQINPNHIPAYNGLGKVYAIKEKFEDAIKAFNKCIELNPKHEFSHNSLGNVYFYRGQYDEAIKWYQKSIQINPKYTNPYGGLCNVYGKKGDESQARRWLQKKAAVKTQQ